MQPAATYTLKPLEQGSIPPLRVAVPSRPIAKVNPSISPLATPTVAAIAPEVPKTGAVGLPEIRTSSPPVRSPDTASAPTQGANAYVAPPIGTPQILGASVSPTVVAPGMKVDAAVRTTPEVVTVVAKVAGQTIPVPRIGTGRFAGTTTVPFIPPFFHGKYDVTFIASNSRGVTTQAAVKIIVR